MIAVILVRAHRGAAAPVHGNAIAVVDAAHRAAPRLDAVDSRPGAIAYGAGSIWVASPDSRSVARISPSSRRVVASIPLGGPAQGLAAAGRRLWAVGSSPTDRSLTLDRIDPTFDTAARVRRLPMVVAGRQRLNHAARRRRCVVAPRAGHLTRIDARSGRTLSRIDPNVAPAAVAPGFGSSWLAYREANLVVRVDSLGAHHADPGRAGTVGDRGRPARRLGRERARRDRQVDRPGHELGSPDDPGRQRAVRDPPKATASGWRTAATGRFADRRAHEPPTATGRGRRKPAGARRGGGQGVGERPAAAAPPSRRAARSW